MKRLPLIFLAFVVLTSLSGTCLAQEEDESGIGGQWSVGGTLAQPRAANIGTGKGVDITVGDWAADVLYMGANLGYLRYGFTNSIAEFSRVAGPALPITEVETTNGIFTGHFTTRLQEAEGTFRPYVSALIGFKYLFTSTKVDSKRSTYWTDERYGSATNFSDWVLSGGIGGGVDIQIATYGDEKDPMSLRLGARYLKGREGRYLEEGPLVDKNDNGRLDSDELRIREGDTSFIQYQIGLTYRW